MPRRSQILVGVLLATCACGPSNKKIVVEDYAEGRVVDLSVTDKLTGNREMLFFSMSKKTEFLEGYIQGIVTDYDDQPVQGVVVRAIASGEASIEEGEGSRNFAVSSFDPGVSDTNGFYKIRFTLPILDKVVDVRGKLLYNPGWEQERDTLGKAYEPQLKQSQFHLYYDRKHGRIMFSEGIRKSIVKGVFTTRQKAGLPGAAAPGAAAPGAEEKKPEEAKKGEEDLFKGFGFGGP